MGKPLRPLDFLLGTHCAFVYATILVVLDAIRKLARGLCGIYDARPTITGYGLDFHLAPIRGAGRSSARGFGNKGIAWVVPAPGHSYRMSFPSLVSSPEMSTAYSCDFSLFVRAYRRCEAKLRLSHSPALPPLSLSGPA